MKITEAVTIMRATNISVEDFYLMDSANFTKLPTDYFFTTYIENI